MRLMVTTSVVNANNVTRLTNQIVFNSAHVNRKQGVRNSNSQ